MPFVAWVTRAERFQDIVDRTDPLGGLPRSCFEQLGAAHGAIARPSGALWFHYPDDGAAAGEPWFAATFRAPAVAEHGHIQLSTSFTSPTFLRNAVDMLELAVQIAAPYGARVFEEAGGRELDRDTVDSLLDPGGAFIRNLGQVWLDVRARLGRQARAPLEFPLGGVDEVSDYFVFQVQTEAPMPGLSDLLEDAHVVPHGAIIADLERDEAAVRITPLDPTCVVVQPAIGTMPFRDVARATLDTLDRIHARAGGKVLYLGRPVDRALRDALEHYATGLGVELYEALVQRPVEPPPPA
jgi:hypothetical protein